MDLSDWIALGGVAVAVWALLIARSANEKAASANVLAEREFGRNTEAVALTLDAETTGVAVPSQNGVIRIANGGDTSACQLSVEIYSSYLRRRESYSVVEELKRNEVVHFVPPEGTCGGEPILEVDLALIYKTPAGNPKRQESAGHLLAPASGTKAESRGPWPRDEVQGGWRSV